MGTHQVDVLWANKTELAPGSGNYKTSHIFYHLFYVLDGSGLFTCGDSTFPIKKGDGILVPPYAIHELPADEHSLLSLLEIKFSVASPYLNQKLTNVSPLFPGTPFIKSAASYVVANWMRSDQDIRTNVECILTTLLLTLFLESEPSIANTSVFLDTDGYNSLTKRAICFMEENYDTAFSINQLADSLKISPTHVCKVFKANTGHTIIEYLNYVRIRSALSGFYHGDRWEILTMALYVGFSNQVHFNRVFKRLLGTTPSCVLAFFKMERSLNTSPDAAGSTAYERLIGNNRLPFDESLNALKELGRYCINVSA